MSRQFNFYATYNDEEEISKILLSVLGDFYIVPERGDINSMTPKLMSNTKDVFNFCNTGKIFTIIKKEFLELFQFVNLDNNMFNVDYHLFPCLEYSRSIRIDEKTITLGRLVYFYDPRHPHVSDVQKLFKCLKKISKRINETGYWIFDEASRCCEYLKMYETWNPETNPYYQSYC
jgi:hypothetical protein